MLCAALPCVIMCFIIPWMDESLKYLVVSSEPEKAEALLQKIAATNKSVLYIIVSVILYFIPRELFLNYLSHQDYNVGRQTINYC